MDFGAIAIGIREGYSLYLVDGGYLAFSMPDANGYYWDVLQSPQRLQAHRWHHVGATYDGQYMRIYIDGIECGQKWHPGGYKAPTGNCHIGSQVRKDGSIYGYYNGKLDEMSFYSGALSGYEVASNYINEAPRIFAGSHHTVVKTLGYEVCSVGWNNSGQLGNGTTSSYELSPVRVAGLGNVPQSVKNISAGYNHNVSVKCDGTLWYWGKYSLTPSQVSSSIRFKEAAAGLTGFSIALSEDGNVYTWGFNSYGQLGNGTTYSTSSPAKINIPGYFGAVSVAAGATHSVALISDGTVTCWGSNKYGQLGLGTDFSPGSLNPEYVTQPSYVYYETFWADGTLGSSGVFSGAKAITAGQYFSVALKKDGTVWAWGDNQYGQLGDGTRTNRKSPVQVLGLSDVKAISAKGNHVVALKNDGTVWTWGLNRNGQLGDGSSVYYRARPVQVSGLKDVIAVSAGGSYTLALKKNGTLWAWGDNYYGQLADGTREGKSTPSMIYWPAF